MSSTPINGRIGEETVENTLDEPVLVTIKRDLQQIATKITQVLYPVPDHTTTHPLQNWDW